MHKSTHKKIFRILLLFMLGASCISLYTGSRLLRPEKLGTLIENQLSKRLGMMVSINKAELNLWKGLHVYLSDFRIGSPAENLFIKADRIGVDLSLWKILFGELSIQHIQLDSPEIHVLSPLEFNLKKSSGNKLSIPATSINNGTILTYFKEKPYALKHINGMISHDFLNLNTQFFNSRLQIFARLVGEQWAGQIKLDEFQLKELASTIKGSIDIRIGFQEQKNRLRLITDIQSDNINFPGGGKPFEQLSLTLICTADDNNIQITRSEFKTADIFFSGTGEFQSPFRTDSYGNIPLKFVLKSDSFDYENFISYLPIDELPEWAIPLFYHQIQGGDILINQFGFDGRLADLIDSDQLFKDLHVDATLSNLSFGAGYGPERITGISGTLKIASGDLLVQNISGYTENAKLQCLDLILPDLMAPDLRTIVDVDLDMPAKEFRYLWRASMEPKVVYDLLKPLSLVTNGNIKANVRVQDNLLNKTTQVRGKIELNECDFVWGENQIETLSGSVVAENFSSKIKVDISGKLNQLPIQKFILSLEDVFTIPRYRFSVKTKQLPKIPSFELLPGASVLFTGSGKDSTYQGTATLATAGFTLFDNEYTPPTGNIQGNGTFYGTLRPEENIHFKEIKLAMDSGLLGLEFKDGETRGFVTLQGIINLAAKDRDGNTVMQNVRGGLDMGLAWETNNPLAGHIQLKKLSIIRNNTKILLNGPVEVSGKLLSTTGLSVLYGDLKTKITGSLSLKANTQHFTGELFADRFLLGNKKSLMTDDRLPDSLTANIYITALQPTIFEIPFKKGEARLKIENNMMHFHDIRITGESGKVNGSLIIDPGKKNVMDLDIDLRNKGLKKLFQGLDSDKTIKEGYMRLSGKLQGATDSINGHLVFNAKDGYTDQSPLLSNIFAAMNLYKIVTTKNIDIRKKHFTYNQISSTFTIKNSIVSFDDFLLDSDSIQFSAVGQYRMKEKNIDALIGVQPFETIDKVISAIPVIGWALTGDGDELFVICLKAEGSIDDPQVNLAPNDTVSKPMANTLLRILKLPGKIITKPGELIRRHQKK